MNDFLHKEFLDNSVENILWAFGTLVIGLIALRFLGYLVVKLLSKRLNRYTDEDHFDIFYNILKKPLHQLFLLIIIYIAASFLHYPEEWDLKPIHEFGLRMIIAKTYSFILGFNITWLIVKFTDCIAYILKEKAEKTDSKQDDQLVPFITDISKVIIWIFGILVVISNVFNINVGSLVAGLGIGGLAVALAAQETLENLLGSFTIFLDKPFMVGDLVTVNGITGTVERVGLRSTRIRTLEKSYVTVPNKKMINAELDNLTLRTSRRVDFMIGLVYGTKHSDMQNIINEVQHLIDNHPQTSDTDNIVRFFEFANSSLNIRVIYFVNTMDWNVFLDVKQEINFKIMEIVEKNNTSFAFPSTSVYIEKFNQNNNN
jgi:MscS family membrane protein